MGRRPEEAGEGKQRSGQGLRRAVTRQKRVLPEPAVAHRGLFEQRQDNVAPAENQRPRAIELRKNGQPAIPRQPAQERQEHQQPEKGEKQDPPRRGTQATGRLPGRPRRPGTARHFLDRVGQVAARTIRDPTQHGAEGDHPNLRQGMADEQDQCGPTQRHRCPGCVGSQLGRHLPDGVGHHRHSGDLQTGHPTGLGQVTHRVEAQAEGDHQDRRRQGETDPRGKRPPYPSAPQPERKAHLAARRTGEELTQRKKVTVVPLAQPLAPGDELVAEVT